MALASDAWSLEHALSDLTAVLPDLPVDALHAHAATADALAAGSGGPTAALAAALARALRLYADGRVPHEGWGLVVSSAHTLARALDEPDGGHGGAALTAARFELESLLPGEGPTSVASAPRLVTADVPLTSLRRRT